MTIGWTEALIILILVAFLVALAFRGGYVRGRMKRISAPRNRNDRPTPD
ncbi:MAG: hypothetical protein NZ699_16770 [Roseiflexus sp.]|nr:hypothetical protein [Roseiflexus sp.]MCS7290776.1 hypothetical protein [Roseiflexus sp.]MDW8146231.1 hypothetical protein [Roseiflexaceae bacterium]MDW8231405.1 hypothetical protein [Roseiflexaceae bacterium]